MQRDPSVLLGCLVALAGVVVSAGQARPAQQPVFRAGTEIVELDVSVLDKDHKPVRGLTKSDFTIQEDGRPQQIVAFTAVDLPAPVPPSATWMTTAPRDVETNQIGEARIVVIVLDDALVGGRDPWKIKSTKDIARTIVNDLGPSDLAAVIFTGDNRSTQDFTTDHPRLLAAIDKFQFTSLPECIDRKS